MSELLNEFKKGSVRALSRLITWAESKDPALTPLLADLYDKTGKAKILGFTGPPGAGKSTILGLLIKELRSKHKSVAVIAVDPTSPFTGGAILGDRIRLAEHFNDDKVYIRSLGTRGKLGGLSLATRQVIHLADAFGFDYILVETVGVGQTEIDIRLAAQCTTVLLVPESGDSIQTLKSGLMEIADILVVNKSDREGADKLTASLSSMLEIAGKTTPVLTTQASSQDSVRTLLSTLEAFLTEQAHKIEQRKQQNLKQMIEDLLENQVAEQTKAWLATKDFRGKNPYRFVLDFAIKDPLKDLFLKWQG